MKVVRYSFLALINAGLSNLETIFSAGLHIMNGISYWVPPHKLIRHPDMPKGVFQLFWDALNRGEPIGAYVKNKASDGLHYWVFAVAMPFYDGFLSVRIKPSSEILQIIEAEYADLLQRERKDGLKPSESAEILMGRINALGFANYSSFESECLLRVIKPWVTRFPHLF